MLVTRHPAAILTVLTLYCLAGSARVCWALNTLLLDYVRLEWTWSQQSTDDLLITLGGVYTACWAAGQDFVWVHLQRPRPVRNQLKPGCVVVFHEI